MHFRGSPRRVMSLSGGRSTTASSLPPANSQVLREGMFSGLQVIYN